VPTTADLPEYPEEGYLYYVQDTGHAWSYHYEDTPEWWEDLGDFSGDPGPPGPQGPQGAQGPVGLRGPAGPSTPSSQGPPGPQGATGAAGPQGPQGAEGPQGVTGPDGAVGAQGPQGPQGDTGEGITILGEVATPNDLARIRKKPCDVYVVTSTSDLHIWSKDTSPASWVDAGQIVGPQGPIGPEGVQGAAGPKGDQGVPGPQGEQGVAGATGLAGAAGVGMQGPVGPPGVAGADGATGAQGAQGPQGLPGAQGAAGSKGDPGATGAQGPKGDTGATGSQGPQGTTGATGTPGAQGPAGSTGPQGPTGASGATTLDLLPAWGTASAAATNLAVNVFNAVSDPNFRQMVDLRGKTKLRIMGRIGAALAAATKLRLQYHTSGNPAIATGDAGWTTLADTAGGHTVNTLFYSAELLVPAGAQINDCLVRVGLFSGDGTADPTITCCMVNFYP
jgi:hypothetical protein